MNNQNIFIHIPKTGGTTINCVMNKSKWQTEPDFFYRHIDHQTKRSNSKDIFNPLNYSKYKNYNIFMLLRHPVDRIISEYYFIKDRKEFLSLLKHKPTSLKQYVENRQTRNYMIGFLVGKRMYDNNFVDKDDYELVRNGIHNIPIYIGIFEKYKESMAYFENVLKIKWPRKIDVKRITLNRPQIEDVPEHIQNLIIENNSLDFQLYKYCLDLFEQKTDKFNVKRIHFNKDRYNYVLKYTERFCLLNLELRNKDFIQAQIDYFQRLNDHLHKKLKVKDGKSYVNIWNRAFVSAISSQFPNSILAEELKTIFNENEDPLEQTKLIANILDFVIFNKDKRNKKKYFSKLIFDEKLVKKSSFFGLFR